MRHFLNLAILGLTLCAGACAHAVPVTYTLSGTISGEFAGTGFTSTQFVLTGTSDTELLESPDPGVSLAPLQTLVIELAGIGSFDALNKAYFFTNRDLGLAGFLDQLEGDLIDFAAPRFTSYDGVAAIDALAVAPDYLGMIGTSGGLLTLSGASQLILEVERADVALPEPGTLVLMLGPLALLARRRPARTAARLTAPTGRTAARPLD
jgi:hypothetical protein